MKIKLNWKIWFWIIIVIFSLLAIFGNPLKLFQEGVVIISVIPNSTAFEQGLRQGQIIIQVDEQKITNIDDFSNALQGKYPSEENIKTIFKTKDSEIIWYSQEAPDITVSEIPKTNLKTGLDLAGGSRARIQAKDKKLTTSEAKDLAEVIENRFNIYGISDVRVTPVRDLFGDNFVNIEIAGATPKDLEKLISEQGKFEANIGNETVFVGGEKDIASVCKNDATCAGIQSCQESESGHFCNFRFVIYLSEEAAKKHAKVTEDLEIDIDNPEYLSEKLELFLDDTLVNSLFISKGLQGQVTTQIAISGSESGETQEEAYNAAKEEMHNLQTILITGSLPYELEIVKLDTISPVLGKDFIKSIFLAALAAIVAVAIVIFFRYKKFKSSIALLAISASEIVIILGIASFIDWNLDLPSIAGIIASIGTGIDSQIIILDEAKQSKFLSIKQKMKRALSIILGAYFTALVALIPLLWAGAGLLKGFAITTIIGITIGVLITRPAFAEMVKKIEKD
ncbi:PDZ domain-containing protein [Candidatus Pacearchaeota archaeon]|nr:PDZ domain-containing protein [Candidatus Pacearchaeota archaeon]